MLAAEKLRYLEDMEPVRQPVRRENLKPGTKAAPAAKPRTLSNIVSVCMVLICFATASFVVFRYAVIAENHQKILKLEEDLKAANAEQEKLKVELAGSEDLNRIEFAATADLGMHYPDEGQLLYVDVPQPDRPAEVNVASKPEESLWSRILGIFN